MSTYDVWAHPQLAAQVIRPRRDGRQEAAFRLASLQDARQVMQLDQLLHALPGVQRVRIDVASRRAHIIWDASRTTLPALLRSFENAHCPAQPLGKDMAEDIQARETRDLLKRLLVAGMFAMQVMTYAFVIYLGVVDFVDFTTRGLFRWLGFLSSLPVIFYGAYPFTRGALREIRSGQLGMNVPIAAAVWLVFLASAFNTLRGQGEVYFDSITMFVFLLLTARYVELRAEHRNTALGDAVADGTPLLAQRRGTDGSLELMPAMELLPGDRVHIADGATVPADGLLESDLVQVDESLLTGESRPVTRHRGERMAAGSIVIDGPAELRVERSGQHTAAARIGALSARTRLAREAAARVDHADLRRFVGRVLLLTLLTAAGWLIVNPSRAFEATVAVLVIACPCAFALSAPSALVRALGVLAQRGVLVVNSGAIDTLARVDVAVFDKTGTLTTPRIDLSAARVHRPGATSWMQWAGALATRSSHPMARAVTAATGSEQPTAAKYVSVVAGSGITGEIEGHALRLGRAMDGTGSEDLHLSDDRGLLATLRVDETVRPDAVDTLRELRADGVALVIASGDAPSRVTVAAANLGVNEVHARQTPLNKLALLKHKKEQGHVTLAVGDGNNDAPILAAADVSAALASGTELAQAHADLLLLHGQLHGLVEARHIARQVQVVVAQGRRWSLAYNLCAVPFAALGLVPPWLAAIGMSASSLAVVINAMRIGRDTARHEARA
ncbi:heavy metal translocating P-type ATPase [Dyella telluris]|uniref:Cation-translocating P-type ATPase n=1 Tax=Dyella telluris TaxID=2763498 RepID=A0A7G8Q336_9GAMM|nr:cation-translocating P-type ATPase [Dyella telluris]QNK01194.1 cation-translocating P-type ATPase [Dyella telluris]